MSANKSNSYFNYKAIAQKNKGKIHTIAKILALVFCVLLTLMFASVMTGGFFLGLADQDSGYVKISSTDYYALSYGTFDTLEKAEHAAAALKARGGAGYIHKESSYTVFAALYLNKADAESVAKRMSSSAKTFAVHKVNLSSYKLKYDTKLLSSKKMNEVIACFNKSIKILYDLFVNLDSEKTNEIAVLGKLNEEKANILKLKSEFDSAVSNDTSQSLLILKAELLALQINFTILTNNAYLSENLSTQIKFYMLKIVFSYQNFIAEIR